jgi:hypothetical protein
MNMLRVLNVVLLGLCCVAADPTWDAVKEAEQDIRSGHIKFYWAGSIASRPVGVPIEVAKNLSEGECWNWLCHQRHTASRTTGRICPPLQREDLRLHHTEALMRFTLVIVALALPVIALALPDDATLSRLLVGTWQGPRHETQYRADGTWVLDPPDEGDNTRGKWRIEHGRLIETWRFRDESSDSTSVEEIIELTEKIFKSRIISQEGPGKPEGQVLPSEIFTVTRVTEKK